MSNIMKILTSIGEISLGIAPLFVLTKGKLCFNLFCNVYTVCVQFDVAPAKPAKGPNWMVTFEALYGHHPKQCPCCGKGILLVVATIEPGYRIRQRDGPKRTANPGFGKRQA
jgi:hypothetical protein